MSNSSESFVKTCVLLKASYDVFVDFPSNGYKICYAVMFAVNIILIIPTVLLNGASVIAILKCSKLNTKVYFFLVLVQSIIDLTVGLLGLPLLVVVLATELFGSVNCVVSVVAKKIMLLPSSFAIGTLIALTFERYMGLIHPFSYEAKVTREKMLTFILLYVASMLISCAASLEISELCTMVGVAFVIFFIVFSSVAYTRMFLAVRKLSRVQVMPNNIQEENRTATLSKREQFLRDVKLMKTCFMVLLCFLLCFLPIAACLLFKAHFKKYDKRVLLSSVTTVVMMNSTLNSLIFVWGKPLLRKEMVKIMWRTLSCFKNNEQ